MPVSVTNKISEAEYLEIERAAEFKSEYYQGEMFAMAGVTYRHAKICTNLIIKVGPYLSGKSCDIFGTDLRVHVSKNSLYTYPDALIVCGKPEFLDHSFDTLINPSVIFEILSPSTMVYDRGQKFKLYRGIPSLREYILISSENVGIEIFRRQPDNTWVLSEYDSSNQNFKIEKIGYEMKMSELYEGVDLAT